MKKFILVIFALIVGITSTSCLQQSYYNQNTLVKLLHVDDPSSNKSSTEQTQEHLCDEREEELYVSLSGRGTYLSSYHFSYPPFNILYSDILHTPDRRPPQQV